MASTVGGLIGALGGYVAAGRSVRANAKKDQRRSADQLARAIVVLHGEVIRARGLPTPFLERHTPAEGRVTTSADVVQAATAVWEAQRLEWGPSIRGDIWRTAQGVADVVRAAGYMHALGETASQNLVSYLWFVRGLLLQVAEGNRFYGAVPVPDLGDPPISDAIYWHQPVHVHPPWRPATVRLWSGGNLGLFTPGQSPIYPIPGWEVRAWRNARSRLTDAAWRRRLRRKKGSP